jgi:superkiller protein 3
VTPETSEDSRTAAIPETGHASVDSLEAFIAKMRKAAAEARPPARKPVVNAESADPRLAAALAIAEIQPSPEAFRAVASEYRRLGVADKAHEYVDKAAALGPRDAVTYQLRARLWRDGGFPERALSDAHRAVYYAPLSAAAHNTLGTVFQALGRRADARQQYERAVSLDPNAAYAWNNLCYARILERQAKKAVTDCRAALQLDPTLQPARNNLGLAYAVSGDVGAARAAFTAAGDAAAAEYNLGIVQLAQRRYADAVTAFAAAQQIRPDWRMAAVRAQQAQKLAKAGAEE